MRQKTEKQMTKSYILWFISAQKYNIMEKNAEKVLTKYCYFDKIKGEDVERRRER